MVVSTGKRVNGIVPDGLWAWVAAFGACVTLLLVNGTNKSLGVMLPHLQDEFSTDTWVIGLIVSLGQGFGAIICPLAAAISKRITIRYTLMIFGLLTSIGMVLGSLTEHLSVFAMSILLTGFGAGADGLSIAALHDYFIHNYDSAAAFAIAGVGAGVMIMPPLTQFFIYVYGWRGSMLLVGGLNLQMMVCGAALKPIERNVPVNTTMRRSTTRTQSSIIGALGFKLFRSVQFATLVAVAAGTGYVNTGWTIYLVPHILDVGFQPYDAAFLATLGGFGHIAGSVAFPLLTKAFSSKQMLYIATASNVLSLLLDPISSGLHWYVGLALSCVTFGAGRSILFAVMYKLVNAEIDDDHKTVALMWIHFSSNCGALASGFISGWLFDQTYSYTASFLLLSAVPLFTTTPRFICDISQYMQYQRLIQND